MLFMLEKVRQSPSKLMRILTNIKQYIVDHQNRMD